MRINEQLGTFPGDRAAIAELFNRYADALDTKQWQQLEQVFTEDASGDFPVDSHCHGRREIIDFIKTALATDEIVTHHMFGNFSVSFDGNSAKASVHMRAYHGGVGPREGLFEESLGSFTGRFLRTVQGWRCSYLREEIFVMLGTPDVFQPPGGE